MHILLGMTVRANTNEVVRQAEAQNEPHRPKHGEEDGDGASYVMVHFRFDNRWVFGGACRRCAEDFRKWRVAFRCRLRGCSKAYDKQSHHQHQKCSAFECKKGHIAKELVLIVA